MVNNCFASDSLRSAGFFPEGYATVMVPSHMLLVDLNKFLLSGEHSRAGIEEQVKKVRLLNSGTRAMTTALKKGCADMMSALNTVKAATALQNRGGAATAKAAAKAKHKLCKLPAFACTSDPSIIKIHRLLVNRQEIQKATAYENLATGSGDANQPFILRPAWFTVFLARSGRFGPCILRSTMFVVFYFQWPPVTSHPSKIQTLPWHAILL